MQNILKAIELKKELDDLRPLTKDQEAKIMQKFRLDWNYHSNHLEGNSLTFGETKNLILHGITAQGKPLKDHFEITGHNEALDLIIEVINEERPLTENFIRELHELLLKEPYYVNAKTPNGIPTKKLIQVGKYKTTPNHVETITGEIFWFAEPEETPAKMYDLLEWYKNKKEEKDVNPIILAAEFHYKFIIIHPFDDGNGRLARILMNFILMSFAYPPVIIKTDNKLNYFFALRQADNNDIEFFVDFISKNLVRSLEIMIAGAKGESIEDPDDIDKQISLLEHKLNSLTKQAKSFKSKETMTELFRYSLSNFLQIFITYNQKLNKFYANTSLELQIDNEHSFPPDLNWLISYVLKIIENGTIMTNIKFIYKFNSFSFAGFDEFNYGTELKFRFSQINYQVNIGNKTYEKNYDEIITPEEIINLINPEIKRHNSFIEQKITEFENKNPSKK